ncbi:hypothetical protein Tco_0708729 [Tanacetum coccineum]
MPRPRGKRCEKNYSSMRRYVADPDNASPNDHSLSFFLKERKNLMSYLASSSGGKAVYIASLGKAFKASNYEYVAQIRGMLNSEASP